VTAPSQPTCFRTTAARKDFASFPFHRAQRETGSEESDIHPGSGIVVVKDLYIPRGESGLGDMRRPGLGHRLLPTSEDGSTQLLSACSISGPNHCTRVSRVER
jgi:hypothetical protein